MNRKIRGAGPDRTAHDRALGLLARREYSGRELRARLEHAGCDDAESAAALAQLRAEGYQDDDRFGGMIVRTRVGQGYGPERIHAELRSHGLADAAIRVLLDAESVDWLAQAQAQLRKRYGGKPAVDRAERGKRAAFLARRGFAAQTARIAVHSEVGEPGD